MYTQICYEERAQIYLLLLEGLSHRDIGKRLERAGSTISREIERNLGNISFLSIILLVHSVKPMKGAKFPIGRVRWMTKKSRIMWFII